MKEKQVYDALTLAQEAVSRMDPSKGANDGDRFSAVFVEIVARNGDRFRFHAGDPLTIQGFQK